MKTINKKPDNTVRMKDLVGKQFILTGVDFTNPYSDWEVSYDSKVEHACSMRMRIDSTTYVFLEDPDDGYRSSLDDIYVHYNMTTDNEFEPVFVRARYYENKNDDWEFGDDNEVLEFVDTENDKVIVQVGTANTNDYYPWYVAKYFPENLSINEGR